MIKELYYTLKTLNSRPSGRDSSILRLICQSLPMYFLRNGYSLPPLNLYLSVNSSCNLKCKMCDIGQDDINGSFYRNIAKEEKADLSFELIKKIIDEVSVFKPTVHVCCVEPLLYKDIGRVCRYISDKGMNVDLLTNGLLLENKIEEIVYGRVRNLWVSLDGPPDIHDSIRGVKGAFELIRKGLVKINDLKKSTGLRLPVLNCYFVTSNYNYFCLEDFIKSVYGFGFKRILISHMNFITKELSEEHNAKFGDKYISYPANISKVDPLAVDTDVLYEQVKKIKRSYIPLYKGNIIFSPSLGRKGLRDYYHNHRIIVTRSTCFIPWGSAQINADGEMIIFSRCLPLNCGNIKDRSFFELWNGAKMREFRKDLQRYHYFPACSRCIGIL